jgi:hypothetical protein
MIVNKIKKICSNPEIIVKYITSRNKQNIRRYLSIKNDRKRILSACNLVDDLLLQNTNINKIIDITSNQFGLIKYPIAWYVLIRKYSITTIVETGVSMGWSSFMILEALNRQKKGSLYSIDLNDSEIVKENGGVGYLVPSHYKKRWNLILGDSKVHLENLLRSLNSIDMFIHDSAHTDEHMSFEYGTAWKHLKMGGILCSDDINHSNAFKNFTSMHEKEISGLTVFQEISRPSDDDNLRPMVGFFFKSL